MPSRIKIKDRYVGQNQPTYFIAEIGLNHNGSLEVAKKLIYEAKLAGADAVKFQKRNSKTIFTQAMLNSEYQSPHAYGVTYGEHREKLELDADSYLEIFEFASNIDIQVFASVWDKTSVDFMEQFGVHAYKIASADLDNWELIEKIALTNKPIILSTGMSNHTEIARTANFTRKLTEKYIFMHCTSIYPAKYEDLNLLFINKIKQISKGNPIGYSGHEVDILPSLIAQVLGVSVIERHITLDKSSKGSDHAASLLPIEFKELVELSLKLNDLLGTGEKLEIPDAVVKSRRKLGKSLYYSRDLPKGHRLKSDDLEAKSPGEGLAPSMKAKVLGSKLNRPVLFEELVQIEDLI
jgi:sialic acid synthase SpsE